MNKLKNSFLIAICFSALGCANMHWDYYYPYCQINPNYIKKNQPDNFENCLTIIDTVLNKKTKEYFKNQDSAIAVIDICSNEHGIAELFINRFHLDYRRKLNIQSYNHTISFESTKPSILLDNFEAKGIDDPEAMVRVIFSCYYKKLNKLKYNWDTEIKKNKSYWISSKLGDGFISSQIKNIENKIFNEYHFNQLDLFDTVEILYNRPPRVIKNTPDWFYLTGIIESKIPEKEMINIKLIDIKSDVDTKYVNELNDTLRIGDTITDNSKGWLKRGIYYFNYKRNKEYRE